MFAFTHQNQNQSENYSSLILLAPTLPIWCPPVIIATKSAYTVSSSAFPSPLLLNAPQPIQPGWPWTQHNHNHPSSFPIQPAASRSRLRSECWLLICFSFQVVRGMVFCGGRDTQLTPHQTKRTQGGNCDFPYTSVTGGCLRFSVSLCQLQPHSPSDG